MFIHDARGVAVSATDTADRIEHRIASLPDAANLQSHKGEPLAFGKFDEVPLTAYDLRVAARAIKVFAARIRELEKDVERLKWKNW